MRKSFSPVVSSLLLLLLPGWGLALQVQTTADFFNDSTLQEIRLTMAPADWTAIHENYLGNGYYPCDLQWNNITLPRIGIRSRGSQSRSPIKPSIGLDFGKYVSGQQFLGLKTLVLRNLNQDSTMMHERLAESVFARLGLPHSREAHARLYVNGEYVGVYLIVENLDTRFLQTQLGDDTGYLYDYTIRLGFRFNYLGPDPATYTAIFGAKTHTEDPDIPGLIDTIRLINDTPDADFYRVVSPLVDLDDFVAHSAAEQALAQSDGLLGLSAMNNFYLYRWGPTRRAMFLVWDQDGAFYGGDWSVWRGTQENVLLRRALNVPRLRKLYTDTLRNAAAAFGSGVGGWLATEIDRIDNQIHQAMVEDQFKLCRKTDGIGLCTVEEYQRDVDDLRGFARDRAAFILKELNTDGAPGPVTLSPGSITNVASGDMPVTAGSLARIRLALPVTPVSYATAYPLPLTLGGVSVNTSTGPAPLLEVGPHGIIFVVPPDLTCAPQPVSISVGGASSNVVMADVMPTAGGIFGMTHASGLLISATAPAAAGEIAVLYATGAWAGWMAPTKTVQVVVAGKPARILWMGVAPGLIGIEQFNIEIPSGIPPGDVPVVITLDSEPGTPFLMRLSQ